MGSGSKSGWKTRPGTGRAVLVALVLGLFWVVGAGAAQAQAVKGIIWTVGIGGEDGGLNRQQGIFREGSWVPVQVRLRNMTPAPFVGHLAVEQVDLDGDKVMTVGPEFVLPAGVEERVLWTYYWPRPDFASTSTGNSGITSVLVLDKDQQVVTSVTTAQQGGLPVQAAHSILPTDDLVRRSTRWTVVLGRSAAGWKSFEGMWGGSEAVQPVFINSPNSLPDNVLGLDGVDVIVWDAESIKVSDVAPEFQLEAILQWVRAGGHLIISVATQGQEFVKAGNKLQDAVPMVITGTRQISVSNLGTYAWGAETLRALDKPLVQAVGTLRPGARTVMADPVRAAGEDHPLAVTGVYGQGAITVVTIDVSNPDMLLKMRERDWIGFWTMAAGWRRNLADSTAFFTAAEVTRNRQLEEMRNRPAGAERPNPNITDMVTNPKLITLGDTIQRDVDVKDITGVRILVALAFLAIYWLVAGPVGHIILRQYRVVHWSWWIFGGVVVVATAIAGSVVLVLHVNAYDVRHRSFVLGTVNSEQATAVSFYGVYAPVSGPVNIRQPEGPGGFNYLVPLCEPTMDALKSYADPQSYGLAAGKSWEVSPVFRNTLKKMQGRWSGNMAGITGNAEFVSGSEDITNLITGKLTNNSGYELQEVKLIVSLPGTGNIVDGRRSYLLILDQPWKHGESLDVHSAFHLDMLSKPPNMNVPGTMELALRSLCWRLGKSQGPMGGGYKQNLPKEGQVAALRNRFTDERLLYFLADCRNQDDLIDTDRCEIQRGIGRMTDCTKALYAAGGVIIARADNVKSPVSLSVNGKTVEGKGSVDFAWILPVAGEAPRNPEIKPAASLIPSPNSLPAERP